MANWQSPIAPRARILSFGVAGTGKSDAVLTIARKCPDATFHVADNDLAYDDLLTDTERYGELTNVNVDDIEGWEEYNDWWARMAKEARAGNLAPDDWVVFDSLTPTWDEVQDFYVEGVFGKDPQEFFMDVRRAREKKRSGDKDDKTKGEGRGLSQEDWPFINRLYRPLYKNLLTVSRQCHVYCTAEQTELSEFDQRDKAMRTAYGQWGVKPKGQRRMSHVFATVLWFTKNRTGDWLLTTCKDRGGRGSLTEEPIDTFAKTYLWNTAGWRLAKKG